MRGGFSGCFARLRRNRVYQCVTSRGCNGSAGVMRVTSSKGAASTGRYGGLTDLSLRVIDPVTGYFCLAIRAVLMVCVRLPGL